jgi:2-polyprenyl-3-methyl-5-hydroxy-6-metoxy-1,4-benzoquinol methylase
MLSAPTAAVDQRLGSGRSEERFAFGKNWRQFLQSLDEERIVEAEKSLRVMLEVEDLIGKSFLDVGCGSGLFSLAAMRLGASRVHSFDYDLQSVACAQELKQRYFRDADNWTIQQGSVLDQTYLFHLEKFNVVYSWGVLHHTGNMWEALENVVGPVATGGKLFLALYNDQGIFSRGWTTIKRLYNRAIILRPAIIFIVGSYFATRELIFDVFVLRKNPLNRYKDKRSRGMSYFTDLIDWAGGYPFEVAKPEAVFDFFRARGFEMVKLKTAGGNHGNNEFVFIKRTKPSI